MQSAPSLSIPHALNLYLQDLSYIVQVRPPKGSGESRLRKVPLKLLDRVTAHFQPGEMTALMGPSGCGKGLLCVSPPSCSPYSHGTPQLAGKTTLLDVISGRKTSGGIDGDILYGISKPSKSFLARNTGQYTCTSKAHRSVLSTSHLRQSQHGSTTFVYASGYVEQFDTLVDNLTVREMLKYTAMMKLPTSKPTSEKYDAVERIIEKLNLEKCR